MACDLWGPLFPEEESSCYIQPEWQYDVYFGNGFDMMEENALNEKSCIQVLGILITKADTEIDELEKDLVLLQSELAWAEHEEWSDFCCDALREKINCSDISVRKLRNKDENDIENEQSQDAVVLDSRSGSPEQLAPLHKNQKSSTSNSYFIAKNENNGPSVIPKENCTELEVKKANSSDTLANANVKDLIPRSLLPAADQFDEKEVVTILDLETTKKQRIKECGPTLKDKNVIRLSSSKSSQKRMHNLDRTKIKPANAVVKTVSPDNLRHATGLNGKANNSDSRLGAFGRAENLNCDMEQKLCDFAVKSASKRGIKELKVASTDKKGTSNSLFKGEGKKKDSLQVVMRKKAALSDNEHSALTSLIELQDERGKDKTIQRIEGTQHLEEVQMAEIAANDDKLVMNLYMRPQRGKVNAVKTNMESTSASVEEPGLNSKENVSNSSSFSEGNRPWKDANNHSLNYSLSGKIIKKTVHHSQCEAEGRSVMLDASQNTMSLPQKKCKKVSSVPTVVEIRGLSIQMNISKLHGDLNRSTVKTDLAKSEASVDGSCTKGMAPQPFDISNLMKLKLVCPEGHCESAKANKILGTKKRSGQTIGKSIQLLKSILTASVQDHDDVINIQDCRSSSSSAVYMTMFVGIVIVALIFAYQNGKINIVIIVRER